MRFYSHLHTGNLAHPVSRFIHLKVLWCALNHSVLLISQYIHEKGKFDSKFPFYSLLSPPPRFFFFSFFSLWYGFFRCLGRAFYPGMVSVCLEYSPPSFSDDDNSEEGLTTIHSGRHEYAFSLELPQTYVHPRCAQDAQISLFIGDLRSIKSNHCFPPISFPFIDLWLPPLKGSMAACATG